MEVDHAARSGKGNQRRAKESHSSCKSPFSVFWIWEKRTEDVAVLVIYLATEGADHINGCIFEVYNGHVGIYEEPPVVKQVLWKKGSFTSEELAEAMPQTLTKGKVRDDFPNTLPFSLTPPEES